MSFDGYLIEEVMNSYPELHKKYPDTPLVSKGIKIDKFTVTNFGFAEMRQLVPTGTYVRLTMDGMVMMSDTFMERETNMYFLQKAKGDILIGGLGIAMLPEALAEKDDVTSITVIEKNQDLIDLVKDNVKLSDKISIIQGDIFNYKSEDKYDYIWLDIWFWIDEDIYYEEVVPLTDKYQKYLKDESKIQNVDSWLSDLEVYGFDWEHLARSEYLSELNQLEKNKGEK